MAQSKEIRCLSVISLSPIFCIPSARYRSFDDKRSVYRRIVQ
jgi:hypothetical protein